MMDRLSQAWSCIRRVTISSLFLGFVLIFKDNVLENVNVLIFDFLVEKIGYCGREDLLFWSSLIFSGETGLRWRGDLFFLVFTNF